MTWQDDLLERRIKFRPVRPASPQLNGKVERVQQTDLAEFWALVDVANTGFETLQERLGEWQHYYNWQRVHGTTGKTPVDRFCELMPQTPFSEEVAAKFDVAAESTRLARQLKPKQGKK